MRIINSFWTYAGPDYLDDLYYGDYADIRGVGGNDRERKPSEYFLDPGKKSRIDSQTLKL